MVKQFPIRFVIPTLFLSLALLIWLTVMHQFRLDDSFITYRYAQNAARGAGLVYNEGDVTLSTTAPLYAVLLAALSFVVPDFHVLGGLLGAVSIGMGGWLLYELLPSRISTPIRIWAGLIYTLSSVLWLALGMETALWMTLVLAAIRLAQLERWLAAGLLIGLATLTRPDAALPGALLGLMAVGTIVNRFNIRTRWWQPLPAYALAAIIPVVIFGVWAWATYGSPLPLTLGAKSAQAALGITGFGIFVDTGEGLGLIAESLFSQSSLYVTFALLALFGLSSRLAPVAWLVMLWAVLHFLAYTLLGVAPYRWYYVPLLPALIVLMAFGLETIYARLLARKITIAPALVAVMALFPLLAEVNSFVRIADIMERGGTPDAMLPIVDWDAYRQVGAWLRTQTPLDATVGLAEVGQVGFYAERWMTDYLGLLQPEAVGMLERGDLYSWLVGYAPDYLVFQRFRQGLMVLYNHYIGEDAWFLASYQQVAEFDDPRYHAGPVTIFQRVTDSRAVTAQTTLADYDGLQLVALATPDQAFPGEPVRIRLDWQVVGAMFPDLHLSVKALEMTEIPAYDGDYQTDNWQGMFSTWHGFVLPARVEPGGYPLEVSIGPVGGPYTAHVVGVLEVQ